MKIPSSVKIGGLLYTVDIIPGLSAAREDGALGSCDSNLCTILLDNILNEDQLVSVFIHEIIEAINAMYELGLEHRQITSLETALYQVFSDNKLLKGSKT
jgi:hypothetical protein